LDAGKAVSFRVSLVYFASLKPYPTEIPMNGRQLVRYYSNAYLYSPYATTNQRTTVKLASTHLEGHSEAPTPTKVSGDTITYGAYADIKPLSHASLWVHFENHAQFLTISKMAKEYEVSHWGNLAVEQALDVRHDGAHLKVFFFFFLFCFCFVCLAFL
jgi:oligosaccharyltransferase complex subunit alpha (ribophorin I)